MADIVSEAIELTALPKVIPEGRRHGRVRALLTVPGGSRVESVPTERFALELEGLVGDRHFGFARGSTSREPWYPRGTVISNTRQLSILSGEELAEVASRLKLSELRPEWIGGNLVLEGVPNLSFLPIGTRLHFPSGAALLVSEQNGPCRIAGGALASHFPGRGDVELGFVQAAKRRRGLLATVERPGVVARGEDVTIRIPEQWIYPT